MGCLLVRGNPVERRGSFALYNQRRIFTMASYDPNCETDEAVIDWWDEYVQALEYIRGDEV